MKPSGRAQTPNVKVWFPFLRGGRVSDWEVFLLWDVLSAGIEPVETSIVDATKHDGSWWRVVGFGTLLTLSVAVGLVTLVYYDRWLKRRTSARPEGPGAAT